jgi:hypothetical protein
MEGVTEMNHKKIWDKVQDCMVKDFAIPNADLATYVCTHQSSIFSGNNIDLIRIFSKNNGHDHTIKSYGDLDDHQELVMFKGQIFKDGGLCLSNIDCGPNSDNDLVRKEVVSFPA